MDDSILRLRMLLRLKMHSYVSKRIAVCSVFVDTARFEDHNDLIEGLSP